MLICREEILNKRGIHEAREKRQMIKRIFCFSLRFWDWLWEEYSICKLFIVAVWLVLLYNLSVNDFLRYWIKKYPKMTVIIAVTFILWFFFFMWQISLTVMFDFLPVLTMKLVFIHTDSPWIHYEALVKK